MSKVQKKTQISILYMIERDIKEAIVCHKGVLRWERRILDKVWVKIRHQNDKFLK
jgi:hypothetical protein